MRFAAASLLVLALAGSAAAETPVVNAGLTDLLAGLSADQPEAMLAAALSACLAGNGAAEPTSALFSDAGWLRQDEPEMGTIEFTAPQNSQILAMLWDSGGFCMVASESTGTDAARAILLDVAAAGEYDPQPVTEENYCPLLDLEPGLRAELTSSGQDPVCDWDDNSAIRFEWSAG